MIKVERGLGWRRKVRSVEDTQQLLTRTSR